MDKQWDSITREDLLELYVEKGYTDNKVATLFGVTKGQVVYKRRKFDISQSTILFKKFMRDQDSELSKKINQDLKRLLMEKDIAEISREVTHYVFRNGPVEDMHANGQLSDVDMKTLNKYMNNRIATLLYLLKEKDWVRLALFLDAYKDYGTEWDEPELQIEEVDRLLQMLFINKLDVNS